MSKEIVYTVPYTVTRTVTPKPSVIGKQMLYCYWLINARSITLAIRLKEEEKKDRPMCLGDKGSQPNRAVAIRAKGPLVVTSSKKGPTRPRRAQKEPMTEFELSHLPALSSGLSVMARAASSGPAPGKGPKLTSQRRVCICISEL